MRANLDHPSMDADADHAPLLALYLRYLQTARGLAPATIRNYLADLEPFFAYLASEDTAFGPNAKDLRRFVERDGANAVNGVYRRLVRDYVSWLVENAPLRSGRRAGMRGMEPSSHVQRCWRDVHAAASQVAINWDTQAINYGRARFGLRHGVAAGRGGVFEAQIARAVNIHHIIFPTGHFRADQILGHEIPHRDDGQESPDANGDRLLLQLH